MQQFVTNPWNVLLSACYIFMPDNLHKSLWPLFKYQFFRYPLPKQDTFESEMCPKNYTKALNHRGN